MSLKVEATQLEKSIVPMCPPQISSWHAADHDSVLNHPLSWLMPKYYLLFRFNKRLTQYFYNIPLYFNVQNGGILYPLWMVGAGMLGAFI